jgi:hypothetical protein
MPILTEDIKTFIVQRLAMHDTPSMVVEDVKEEFGVTLTRNHVQAYDPTARQGTNLAKKHRELFEKTREEFEAERLRLPIMQRLARVRRLERLYEQVRKMGNIQLAREILAQVAKEAGDGYSNVRHNTHSAPGGGPVRVQAAHMHLVARLPENLEDVPLDELTRVYRDLVTVPNLPASQR